MRSPVLCPVMESSKSGGKRNMKVLFDGVVRRDGHSLVVTIPRGFIVAGTIEKNCTYRFEVLKKV